MIYLNTIKMLITLTTCRVNNAWTPLTTWRAMTKRVCTGHGSAVTAIVRHRWLQAVSPVQRWDNKGKVHVPKSLKPYVQHCRKHAQMNKRACLQLILPFCLGKKKPSHSFFIFIAIGWYQVHMPRETSDLSGCGSMNKVTSGIWLSRSW